MQERKSQRWEVVVCEIDQHPEFLEDERLGRILQQFFGEKLQIVLGSIVHKENHQDEDEFKWNKN